MEYTSTGHDFVQQSQLSKHSQGGTNLAADDSSSGNTKQEELSTWLAPSNIIWSKHLWTLLLMLSPLKPSPNKEGEQIANACSESRCRGKQRKQMFALLLHEHTDQMIIFRKSPTWRPVLWEIIWWLKCSLWLKTYFSLYFHGATLRSAK